MSYVEKNKVVAAFSIKNNGRHDMEVSPLVIGWTQVKEFYEKYSKLPEEERALGKNDVFLYTDLDEAVKDIVDSICSKRTKEFFSHS